MNYFLVGLGALAAIVCLIYIVSTIQVIVRTGNSRRPVKTSAVWAYILIRGICIVVFGLLALWLFQIGLTGG